MKNWLKLLIILFVIVVYVLLINIFSSLISSSYEQEKITEESALGLYEVKISISESVSVSVTRNRWYGNISESNGRAYLYLFGLIKLPHKINNYNFIWFHLIFLINLSLFSVLIFTKRRIYKSENPNLEHEKLGEVYNNSD